MLEYISIIKNNNNQTVLSPSVISVDWGGYIVGAERHLKINGGINFKVLRTAFNRASVLGISSQSDENRILLSSFENGVGTGIKFKLRDKFLGCIIAYVKVLFLENKSRQQIVNSLKACCASATKLCAEGERETADVGNAAEGDFINSLADICHSFGYEVVGVDVATFIEDD